MKFDEVMTESTDEMESLGTDEFIGVSRQMAKRKRTKRQPRITMSSSCSGDIDGCVWSRKDDRDKEFVFTTLSEEEENMANCLILLAKSGGGLSVEENEKTERKRMSREKAEISAVPGGHLNVAYECKTCNKAFQSFQALGGHRASHHKKAKQLIEVLEPKSSIRQIQMASDLNKATDYSHMQQSSSSSKLHECSNCGLVFLSGQALGGHMRRHRAAVGNSNIHQMAPAASDATTAFAAVESLTPHEDFPMNESCIISASSKVLTSLDLNLPAQPEEDQVVCDHGRSRFINQQFVTSQNNRNPATTAPPLVGCCYF